MPDSIVMTMYNRPHYSRAVLDALSRCAGIKNYLIVICVEPGNEAVLRIAKSVNFAESKVYVNPERYGCSRNSYEAMRRGFENSEFVIYVQDDDQLAYDALKYFEFCKNKFRGDGSVYTVCAWNLMKDPCPPSHNHRIMRRDLFISLTMATWKDRWEERGGMRDNWDYGYKQGGWDVHINEHLRKGRWEVYPWLYRAQNIGAHGGTHCPSPEWHHRTIHCEYWADDPRVASIVHDNAERFKDVAVLEFEMDNP